ncbi:hypothetical protein [Polaromonas sp. CG9_12]|nr:hypothetical protein [Polaromonas sp. CG9_12]
MVLLLGALGMFFGVMGGGAKWLLGHIDARAQESAQREELARDALSHRLQDEIAALRADLAAVQKEKLLYLRRIYHLEHFIHTHPHVVIPAMTDWPPA